MLVIESLLHMLSLVNVLQGNLVGFGHFHDKTQSDSQLNAQFLRSPTQSQLVALGGIRKKRKRSLYGLTHVLRIDRQSVSTATAGPT